VVAQIRPIPWIVAVSFCVAYLQVGRVRFEAYARSASAAMAKLEEAWRRHMLQNPEADPWEGVKKKAAIEGRLLDRGYRNGERIA
jgi:hypothetical protein